jgi:hypothetical protein
MKQQAQSIPAPRFPPIETQAEMLRVLAEDDELCTIAITVRKNFLRQDFLQRYRDFAKYLDDGIGGAA